MRYVIVKRSFSVAEIWGASNRVTIDEVVHDFGRAPSPRSMASRETLALWFEMAARCAMHIRLSI
jgi:hypothetical protein